MNRHICHVITTLGAGGAEQYVVQLSNSLVSSGHRVSVIAGEPQAVRNRLDPDVQVKILKLHPGVTRSALGYLWVCFGAIPSMISYFRRMRVTHVHTHLAASALPAWLAAKFCGIPVIHSKMHSGDIGSRFERMLFASCLPLALVDRFLAFTRYSAAEMSDLWNIPPARKLISSIGVDTIRFTHNAELAAASRNELGLSLNDRVLLSVARLHPDKDVELAIRTAKCLDDPNAILLIVGDGPLRNYLESLARDLPGRTRIRFLGLLQDPRAAYSVADVLLQTTRSPDLGTVVLEAMASGVPVAIAHRNDQEYEMAANTLGGYEVGVMAEATPENLAEAIRRVFSDSVRLEAMRYEARSFVEREHANHVIFPAMEDNYIHLERATDR